MENNYKCIFTSNLQRAVRNNGGLICTIYKPNRYTNQDDRYEIELQEAKDYQERICDALNTYNKTPILPSELLKINEELINFITKFRDERFSKNGSMTGNDYDLFTEAIQKLTK